MKKFTAALLALTMATAIGTAEAKPVTPPGPWLKAIKDAVRTALKEPEIVTFNRIFYVDTKGDDGSYPVCGFVSFKQKPEQHPEKQPFFGRFTPAEAGGTLAGLKLGKTDEEKKGVADECKKTGVQ